MKFLTRLLFVLTLLLALSPVKEARAEEVSDWVIRDFQSEIIVNQNSSLDITESITADCGNLPDKHGIFRVIPYQSHGSNNERYTTHIRLVSITDFDSKPLNYETLTDRSNKTITWKIGEAGTVVHGINNYRIKYHVDNVIRTGNGNFDELYWNLNGNFWDITTEKFSARLILPESMAQTNPETNLYAGSYGQNDDNVADYEWSGNVLAVKSKRPLLPREGTTISIVFPKNLFTAYVPDFWERYYLYFYLAIPLLILLICFRLWSRYGRDPKINDTVAPEFEIPENLAPIEFGLALNDGSLKNRYLTAGIMGLAVKGHIKITALSDSGFGKSADYSLERLESDKVLSKSEEAFLEQLFSNDKSINISSLKNKFYAKIPHITTAAMGYLADHNWVKRSSRSWMTGFLVVGVFGCFGSATTFAFDASLAWCLLASSILVLLFAPLMRSRTKEGALLLRRLKGFELYMRKAETYRQQWLEKQNIFETFLPYAIVFGFAKEWTSKMKDIYGEKYFSSYHPFWYYGYAGNFNFDEFCSNINSISNSISTTLSSTPSSSGSGGGGFSGGGGGGGGGGGW